MQAELKFTIPSEEEHGYLNREIRRLEFLEQYEKIKSPTEKLQASARFMAEFVTAPSDPEEAYQMILDAPKTTIDELMDYFVRGVYPGASEDEKE